MAQRHYTSSTCGIEQLEGRRLLSGNVTASIAEGNLTIWGDAVANDIVVDQLGLAAGQVRIASGENVTTVNGLSTPVVLEGFTGDLLASLRRGPDTLVLRDMTLPGHLTVETGLGMDNISLANIIVQGNSDIRTGVRPDSINVDDSTFDGSLFVDTKYGTDSIRIEQSGGADGDRSFFNSPVDIQLGRGEDQLRIGLDANTGNRADFYSSVNFDGGDNYDEVTDGDGNWLDFAPVITNFELNGIEAPLA